MLRVYISALIFIMPCILGHGLTLMKAESMYGSQAMQFITNTLSPRAIGMGGIRTGLQPDTYSHFGNIAATPFSEEAFSIGVSYGKWQPDYTDAHHGLAGLKIKINDRISISAGSLCSFNPRYTLYDSNGISLGMFSPYDLIAGIGAAYKITSRLSTGMAINYARSSVSSFSDPSSTFFTDLQVLYMADSFSLSTSVNNLGFPIKDVSGNIFNIPLNLSVGSAYSKETGSHHIEAGAECIIYPIDTFAFSCGAGIEYIYSNFIAVRVGYHYGDKHNGIPSFAAAGIGFRFLGITIDASYMIASSYSPMRNTFSVGAGYSF